MDRIGYQGERGTIPNLEVPFWSGIWAIRQQVECQLTFAGLKPTPICKFCQIPRRTQHTSRRALNYVSIAEKQAINTESAPKKVVWMFYRLRASTTTSVTISTTPVAL